MLFKKMRGIIGSIFQIDSIANGPNLKNDAGVLEVRDGDDTGYARVRAAAPQGDNDVATRAYVDTVESITIVDRQADTSVSLPPNTANRGFVVVTTAGSGAVIGDLLFDDGTNTGTMQIIPAKDGRTISVTVALTGGTISFEADSLYSWDATGGSWIKVSDVGNVSGAMRVVRFAIDNSTPQDSTLAIPAGNVVHGCLLKIVNPYSGGSSIQIGDQTTANLLMDTTDNNPTKPAGTIFDVPQDTEWPTGDEVRVTVGGAPAAGDAIVVVFFSNPNG
jgi:hypothetical protein